MILRNDLPRARIKGKFRRCYFCGKYLRVGQTYEIIGGRFKHGDRRNCG